MRFSSIESIENIVVGYRYFRVRQGIDAIELVSMLSNWYRCYVIIGIDTFAITRRLCGLVQNDNTC